MMAPICTLGSLYFLNACRIVIANAGSAHAGHPCNDVEP
jgi:hypothetical protein